MKTFKQILFNFYLIFPISVLYSGISKADESWQKEPVKDKYTIYLNNFNSKNDLIANEKMQLVKGKFGLGAEIKTPLTIKSKSLNKLDARQGFVEFWLKPNWEPGKKSDKRNILRIVFPKGRIVLMKIGASLNFHSHFDKYCHNWYPIAHWEKGQWYHLAVYWKYADGFTNYQLYVNGKMVSSLLNTLASGNVERIILGDSNKSKIADAVVDGVRASSVLRHIALRPSPKLPVTARLLPSGKNCQIISQHPAIKIFPNTQISPNLPRAAALNIKSAKGEYESMQVAVRVKNNIGKVRVEFSNLQGPGIIKKENLSVRAIETVSVELPSNQFGRAGDIPDPLPPVEEFNFKKKVNNLLWFTLYVPRSANAGDYSGTITFKNKTGFTEKISITLRVWDFSLPKRPSIKSFALGWFQHIAKYEELTKPSTLYKRADRNMAEHRYVGQGFTEKYTSWSNDGKLNIDFAKADMWLKFLVKDLGMYVVPFPAMPWISHKGKHVFPRGVKWAGIRMFTDEEKGILNSEFENAFSNQVKALADLFRKKKCAEYPTIHFVDELNFDHEETLNKVLALNKLLKKVIPEIKIRHTGYPRKKLLSTTDIWCVHAQHYTSYKKEIEKARQAGSEIWVYYNGVSLIDLPLMQTRMFSWFLKKENIDGHLSWWALAAYYKNDPWKTPWSGKAGGGVLLYPGRNRYEKQFSPISSMRWETMRDGLEDYEYLNLLKINADKQNDNAGKQLYQRALKLVADGEYQGGVEQVYCVNVKKFEKMRRKIAENIVRLIDKQ